MNERSTERSWFCLAASIAAALAGGCAPGAPGELPAAKHAAAPAKPAAPGSRPGGGEPREQPPAPGPSRPFRMPAVSWADLATGVRVATVVSRALPIVEVRVVVPGGAAADGERTGLAALTGQLLKEGAGIYASRELLARIEALGARLAVDTGRDATVLSLAVTRDRMADAIALLGLVVQRPRLDPAEFTKVRARAMEAADDRARTDDAWAAMMVLFRDLYALPAEQHPYGSFAALSSELSRITILECRDFHRKWFVPKNTLVIAAGDTSPEAVRAAVEKAFPDRRGDEPPAISFTEPLPPESLKITVVDRPASTRSELFLGFLGPEREGAAWASFAVAGQVLAGGAPDRVVRDVVAQRPLAYTTSARPLVVAHGPAPLIASAGTQAATTGLAAQALLQRVERLATTAPTGEEVESATRYLTGALAVKLETVGAVAEEVATLRLLGLPDDTYDGYRKELLDITPALANKVAGEYLRPDHAVMVVTGDAQVIGPMLSRFGEVKVVDPTRSFARERTIPKNAGAAPSGERAPGAPAGGAGR